MGLHQPKFDTLGAMIMALGAKIGTLKARYSASETNFGANFRPQRFRPFQTCFKTNFGANGAKLKVLRSKFGAPGT